MMQVNASQMHPFMVGFAGQGGGLVEALSLPQQSPPGQQQLQQLQQLPQAAAPACPSSASSKPLMAGTESGVSSGSSANVSKDRKPSLFLGGIPQDWTARNIEELMDGVTVTGVFMKQGYCFVNFKDSGMAEKKAAELDGKLSVNGKVIGVRVQTKENHEKSKVRRQTGEPQAAAPAAAAGVPAAAAAAVAAQPAGVTTAAAPLDGNTQLAGAMQPALFQTQSGHTMFAPQIQQTYASMPMQPAQFSVAAAQPNYIVSNNGINQQQVYSTPQGTVMLPFQQGVQAVAFQQPQQLQMASLAPQPAAPTAAVPAAVAAAAPPTPDPVDTPPSLCLWPEDEKRKRQRRRRRNSKPSVFVGGLKLDIAEREVRNFFGLFGEIQHVTLKGGFAFIDFVEESSAELAVAKCNGYVYDDKPLAVRIQDSANRRLAQAVKRSGENVPQVFKALEEKGLKPSAVLAAKQREQQLAPQQQQQNPQQEQQAPQQQQAPDAQPQMPMVPQGDEAEHHEEDEYTEETSDESESEHFEKKHYSQATSSLNFPSIIKFSGLSSKTIRTAESGMASVDFDPCTVSGHSAFTAVSHLSGIPDVNQSVKSSPFT